MSVAMTEKFMRTHVGDPVAKAVALALAWHHNGDTGRCDPGIQMIADETEYSPRAIKRALQRLDGIHVTVVRKFGCSSSYKLHPKEGNQCQRDTSDEESPVPERHHTSDAQSLPVVSESHQGGVRESKTSARETPKREEREMNSNVEREKKGKMAASADSSSFSISGGDSGNRKSRTGKRAKIESDCRAANDVPIPDLLNRDGFPDTWKEWCEYRTESASEKQPWTSRAARMLLKECEQHGPNVAVQALTAAMSRTWRGPVWERLQPAQGKQTPFVTRNTPIPPNPNRRSLNETAVGYRHSLNAPPATEYDPNYNPWDKDHLPPDER